MKHNIAIIFCFFISTLKHDCCCKPSLWRGSRVVKRSHGLRYPTGIWYFRRLDPFCCWKCSPYIRNNRIGNTIHGSCVFPACRLLFKYNNSFLLLQKERKGEGNKERKEKLGLQSKQTQSNSKKKHIRKGEPVTLCLC